MHESYPLFLPLLASAVVHIEATRSKTITNNVKRTVGAAIFLKSRVLVQETTILWAIYIKLKGHEEVETAGVCLMFV